MTMPDLKTWETVLKLFDEVTQQPVKKRSAYITALHLEPEVQDYLQQLLVADEQQGGLLDTDVTRFVERALDPAIMDEQTVDWANTDFGPYRCITELGRGGRSVVLLAERSDGRFEKQVAIKLLQSRRFNRFTREAVEAEASILARLQHPNIAQILDAGLTEAGRPYTVMEYCDGVSIIQYCQQQQLSLSKRLRLLHKICLAVHYAHRNLIVHCDLKPANILIQANGEPKILDFDIANRLDDEQQTERLALQLTPEYAAPEQFTGDQPITVATDVYSLGVICYEVLCGRRPFDSRTGGMSSLEIAKSQNDYVLPSRLVMANNETGLSNGVRARMLKGDLDAIIQCAMQSEPLQRYESARAMADDIERHLTYYPVVARGDNPGYYFYRWLRRNRVLATALTGMVGSLIVGMGVALWQADAAKASAARAEATQNFLVDIFEAANPILNQTQPLTANDLIDQGVRKIDIALTDQPLVKSDILNMLGEVQRYLGNFDESIDLHEQAAELLQQENVAPQDLALTYRELYLTYAEIGDYDQLDRLSERLLEMAPMDKRVNEAAVLARVSHARALMYRNEYALAERQLKQTLEYRADIARLTIGDQLVGQLLSLLSQVLSYQDKSDEALTVVQDSKSVLQQSTTAEVTDLATVFNTEARIHQAKGNNEIALELQADALEIFESSYPEDHPRVLGQRNNLATVLTQVGRHREALDYLYSDLEHFVTIYGEHGLNTIVQLGNIALGEFGLRNFDRAAEYYQLAVEGQVVQGRDREFRIGVHRAGLADSLAELGEHERARQQYTLAVDVLEESLGADHTLTLWIKAYLSYHYYQTGEFDQGRQLLNTVSPLLLEKFAESTRQHGYVVMLQGLYAMQSGDEVNGNQLLRLAKSILEQSPGATDRYASQLQMVNNVLNAR